MGKLIFENLIQKRVTFYCSNYIYTGKVMHMSESWVVLIDAGILYETGAHDKPDLEAMQKLPYDLYIQLNAIESFGVMK